MCRGQTAHNLKRIVSRLLLHVKHKAGMLSTTKPRVTRTAISPGVAFRLGQFMKTVGLGVASLAGGDDALARNPVAHGGWPRAKPARGLGYRHLGQLARHAPRLTRKGYPALFSLVVSLLFLLVAGLSTQRAHTPAV